MHPHHRVEPFFERALDLALAERARGFLLHTPADLGPIFDQVQDRMRVLGYPPKDLFAVRLALHEAVTNAFQHGNRSDASKSIYFRYVVNSDEVLFEVEDQGPGFVPDQVPDPFTGEIRDRPHGRGLFLMWAYMTWVSFNRMGNRVTLVKQRSSC